jgi:predicted ArsR family transcriptional regulator|tara:strand:+ start:444 stop:740 length:297 start_codon:yes stop_codon:yes gene_type:complete
MEKNTMATSNANVTVTKESKVLTALQASSKGLTAAQIEARFNVGNARSTVSALRMKGFAIYANQATDTKGRTKTFYRLGTPSRAVVAAGYKAMAMGIV